MSDLPKRLRNKASMIALGERVAWGSDTALMEEAADVLEALSASVENHQLHMLGMARDRDQLRAMLTAQPQASAAQSAHHNLLGELYQVLGALDAPDNVLDNVSAAIHDEPLPHATLLPFVVAAQSAPVGERETIRAVFLRNGFTVKEGQTDLKPYVYAAAEELLSIARTAWQRTQSAGVPDALREAVEYLDDNPFNEIGAGSILHRAMRDALAAAPAHPEAQSHVEAQRLRNWVACVERLPADKRDVMVYCADSDEHMVGSSIGDGLFLFATASYGEKVVCRPTHWRYIDESDKPDLAASTGQEVGP